MAKFEDYVGKMLWYNVDYEIGSGVLSDDGGVSRIGEYRFYKTEEFHLNFGEHIFWTKKEAKASALKTMERRINSINDKIIYLTETKDAAEASIMKCHQEIKELKEMVHGL